MSAAARRLRWLAPLAVLALPSMAAAQDWRASARVGRVTYEGAPAGVSASSSAVLALEHTAPRGWLGASAAFPLTEDPFWAMLGGWKRLDTRGTRGLLLDLTGRGFIQRESVGAAPAPSPGPLPFPPPSPGPLPIDRSGQGVGAEVMAGGFGGTRTLRLETRLGVTGQWSRLGDASQHRTLPTTDARLSLGLAPVVLQAETRAWFDDRITHSYLGGGVQYAAGPLQLWGTLGRWVTADRDGTAWSAGAGAEIAPGLTLQLAGRGNGFDPVYRTTTGTSYWGGLSVRLGHARLATPMAVRTRSGQSVITLPVGAARGPVAIAGDFTGWKPVPMDRDGSRWTYIVTLAPGVYHYAFVAEDGTWFVPESVPGRQDDGMGGQVAVVVVS
jgi:hypothetical protein